MPDTNFDRPNVRSKLLTLRGVVMVEPANEQQSDASMMALDTVFAEIGLALSMGLRSRLRTLPDDALHKVTAWMVRELQQSLGASETHIPLYAKFPEGVPKDMITHWVTRFVVHVAQRPNAPCLFCERTGTTHVLSPCHHIVCDRCFDGSNVTGCPICGNKVDESPFFTPPQPRDFKPRSNPLRVIRLADETVDETSRAWFRSLCVRTQPLSPTDKSVLSGMLADFGEQVLEWIPEQIPLRENIALLFGTLAAGARDPQALLDRAEPFMTTATDVLRFISAYSGQDPSLQAIPRLKKVPIAESSEEKRQEIAGWYGGQIPDHIGYYYEAQTVQRFQVAKMSRALRRAILARLEGMDETSLFEDMLRHKSRWVWIGEFLHPGEYANRYPKAARGFDLVRDGAPGQPAPKFKTFYSRVEQTTDAPSMAQVLEARPGESGRRLDHLLRSCQGNEELAAVLTLFDGLAPKLATPMLVALAAHFPNRTERAGVRVFFPKGGAVTGVSRSDNRDLLSADTVAHVCATIEDVLLDRFGAKDSVETWVLDEQLRDIVVPFNERTAAASAVPLTRGSTVPIPASQKTRMFLHWCTPEGNAGHTDLDLSVALYDADWNYVGVCSYYQLTFGDVAKSSGDFTSAPFPDGASEFVDIDRNAARTAGIRYAVMVVNAYSGLPFDALHRAYAGLMLRDDDDGVVFDPRAVELKFQLAGNHGVYLPLAFDLDEDRLHWIDAYNTGEFQYNNVSTSNYAITRICPESIEYFGSGTRASMFDLGLLHAAARSSHVVLRGETPRTFRRLPDESPTDFLARIRRGEGGEPTIDLQGDTTAMLFRGDLALPAGSEIYALFREQLSPTFAASDLLA